MAAVQLTRELTVTATVSGKTVTYNIFATRADKAAVKATRYSELAALQKTIKSEEPDFRGSLPAKTLRHQTDPSFVESRRQAIESFLQMCATDEYVLSSQAWRHFLADAVRPSTATATSANNSASASAVSATPPVASVASAVSAASEKKEVKDEHESEEEDMDLEGSVYDKLRTQLTNKQSALAAVKSQQNDLNQQFTLGQLAVQVADEEKDVAFAHGQEAVTRLSTHRFSLQELERELLTQKGVKADLESSKMTEVKSLGEGLEAAIEATRTGRTKFEAARSVRSQAEAEGKNQIIAIDSKVLSTLIEHTAATEHLASMRSALSVMTERLKGKELEARKIEIECDVAAKAREAVRQEASAVKEDVRKMAATAMNTSAALTSHVQSCARRARAFDAEVRRAKECAKHATLLRDRFSRGELLGEDRKGFENAESLANKGADSAGKTLAKTVKNSEESMRVDMEKAAQLLKADGDASDKLKRHEVVSKQMQMRHAEVDTKFQNASERRACAQAARKIVKEDLDKLKARVDAELQKALDEADKKLKEAKEAAKETRVQVDKDLVPLSHKEEAERVVLKHAEIAEQKLVQLLDEARTLATEAQADQYEAKAEDHEKVQRGDRRSLLIESAKIRASDHKRELAKATEAAKEAEAAVRAAEPELKLQEQLLETEQAAFRKEVEAVLAEEAGSRGSSFAEEIQNLASSEDDSPVLQEISQKISVMKAVLGELTLVSDEKNATLKAATACSESANKEVTELEEEEKNTEMPPVTAYYLSQELTTVAEHMKRHEDAQTKLLEAAKQREEEWAKQKSRLQEELHQAGISMEVAKDDLEATKAIPGNIRKSLGK